MTRRFNVLALAATAALLLPLVAQAESTLTTGGVNLSATAKLDFQVTIPKVLFLQVGTGTLMQTGGTQDFINFVVPAANVGDGVARAATTMNDQGLGAVTAKVIGNVGNVQFKATTAGQLVSSTSSDTISFTEIVASSANLGAMTPLVHPAFVDGGDAPMTLTATSNNIVNHGAVWTFSYKNSAMKAAGDYGGQNVNNGRVTYTASNP